MVPGAVADEVLARNGLMATGVQFVDRGQVPMELAQELAPHGEQRWCPGGPVSNALHAMACGQWPGPRRLDLVWSGATARCEPSSEPLESPLDSLRRVGITILSTGRMKQHARTLCVMDERTMATRAVVVQRSSLDGMIPADWSASDVLLLTLGDLLHAGGPLRQQIDQAPAVALLLGDHPPLDATSLRMLIGLARSGRLRWILGQRSEFLAQSLLVGSRPIDDLVAVELVATSGDQPVAVWSGAAGCLSWFEVPHVAVTGDDLGAGDAYAGAYLHARLLDEPMAAAHAAAMGRTRMILAARGARVAADDDLNQVFATAIDRQSSRHDEGRLWGRVRRAAGVVVVSGGQTGTDQLGLQVATQLGLPAFCVLPMGRRTEAADLHDHTLAGPDRFGDAHIEELGTRSYRYRTWTTAYLGDGTVLWDQHQSEGSIETRRACRALGRPCLELTGLDEEQMRSQVREWMARHAIRVVNIAGNRGSLLTSDHTRRIRRQMHCLLRAAAFHDRRSPLQGWRQPHGRAPAGDGSGELAIGIANNPAHRALLAEFLRESYDLELPEDRRLTICFREQHLLLVLARPRDLPSLLREGAIDLILCGSDLLQPTASDARVVLDTGLFPLLVVLVGRPDGPRWGALAGGLQGQKIGSQDVPLARHVLAVAGYHGEIRAIHGAAESWIRRGLLDAAVDTWRTGATAQANELGLLHVFGETSLVAAVPRGSSRVLDAATGRFLTRLASWLSGD